LGANFSNEYEGALFIHDGQEKTSETIGPLFNSSEVHLAKKYIEYNKVGRSRHKEIVEQCAKLTAAELSQWADWINDHAFDDKVNFTLTFEDSNSFFALTSDRIATSSQWRDCAIVIGLGCIPLLIGIANRISLFGNGSTIATIVIENGFPGMFDIDKWDPIIDPVGELHADNGMTDFQKTLRITIDSLILIFLHEVAHACHAHCRFEKFHNRKLDPKESRALESDADWCAGYLFTIGLTQGIIRNESNLPLLSPEELKKRLAFSSHCTYQGFQAFQKPFDRNSPYHLPNTRTHCTLSGAHVAWQESFGTSEDFEVSINRYLSLLFYPAFMCSDAFPEWISPDDEISRSDLKSYYSVSQSLTRDILKKLRHMECAPLKGKRAGLVPVKKQRT
jgi:hypothetical protein